jgi:hypothetical protein
MACGFMGLCMMTASRPEGFACSDDSQCATPYSCFQGDWPVTTCGLAPWSISGTVTLNEIALAGVTVNISGTLPRSATTDPSGYYELIGLNNGTYTVQPSLTGYTFDPTEATVTVQDGIVTGVNFTAALASTYEVSGIVTLNGVGFPNVSITLGGPVIRSGVTDFSGHFSIQAPNGQYFVNASAIGYSFTPGSRLVAVDGAPVNGVNFTANVIHAYTVSGTVTLSTGGGASGVMLNIIGISGGAVATTDPFGNFQFNQINEGVYTLSASDSRYTFNPTSRTVSVLGGNVTSQNFTATPIVAYNVSGVVTLGGQGLENISLSLTSGSTSYPATTGQSGSYSVSVTEGTYTVAPAYATGYAFTPESRSVTVSGGDVNGQDFTATVVPTYTVSGHVTKDGVGLAMVSVSLSLNGTVVLTAMSDSAGFYSIAANPGTYTVRPINLMYVFTPAQADVTLTDANVTRDFTAAPSGGFP